MISIRLISPVIGKQAIGQTIRCSVLNHALITNAMVDTIKFWTTTFNLLFFHFRRPIPLFFDKKDIFLLNTVD